MNLLIFFAIPLVTVLLAIVLQKLIKSPVLVAITFFAVYLIIAFGLSLIGIVDLGTALVATIIYTIIAYLTALIVRIICIILKKLERICKHTEENESDAETDNNCCCHDRDNDVAVQGVIEVRNNNENQCNCNNEQNDQYCIRANVSPNAGNNGRTGTFRGCYRRR